PLSRSRTRPGGRGAARALTDLLRALTDLLGALVGPKRGAQPEGPGDRAGLRPGRTETWEGYFDGVACGYWLVSPLNVNGPWWLHAGAGTSLEELSGLLTTCPLISCSMISWVIVPSGGPLSDGAELAHAAPLNTDRPLASVFEAPGCG